MVVIEQSKVAVVGLGYVGLPLAVVAALKYDTLGFDTNKERVKLINNGESHIEDELVEKLLPKSKLQATTDMSVIEDRDIILVCVPTPVKGHTPDLGPLEGAIEAVATHMKKGALLIIESTINPGVCDDIVLPLTKRISGYEESEFDLAHCPERINPGDLKWDVTNINRVIGSNTKKGLERAVEFYRTIIDAQIKPMDSLKEAEAVKIVENSFRDINIAFVNELAMSFHTLGINVGNVIDGAATKPFGYMPFYPGCGVGGHCIPVDPYYLIEYAKDYGFSHEFLSLARSINNNMPAFTVSVLQEVLNTSGLALKGARIALLGLAYKRHVGDDRESPAYVIRELLNAEGAEVVAYDPFVPKNSNALDLLSALKEVDAILIATDHDEFKKIVSLKLPSRIIAIVDGRNLLRHVASKLPKTIVYRGIGLT